VGAANLPGIPHELSALYSSGARELTWLTPETTKMFLSNKTSHANYRSFIHFCNKASYYCLQTMDSSTPMPDRNSGPRSEL